MTAAIKIVRASDIAPRKGSADPLADARVSVALARDGAARFKLAQTGSELDRRRKALDDARAARRHSMLGTGATANPDIGALERSLVEQEAIYADAAMVAEHTAAKVAEARTAAPSPEECESMTTAFATEMDGLNAWIREGRERVERAEKMRAEYAAKLGQPSGLAFDAKTAIGVLAEAVRKVELVAEGSAMSRGSWRGHVGN